MKLTVDTDARTLVTEVDGQTTPLPLYSREAFAALSDVWVAVGWDQRYPYTFSWLGRPIIQLPEDLIRIQELVWAEQPDIIIETGVAHGGGLVLFAGLCAAMGKGRVIGVDIEIRPHNRAAIEAHPLARYITLIEGDSVSEAVLDEVRGQVAPGEKVLVVLDSNHSRDHVRAELEAYGALLGPDDFIVATDGVMNRVTDVPRGRPEWSWDNPEEAADAFLAAHADYERVPAPRPFDESGGLPTPSHWPGAWLRKKAS